MVHSMFYEDQQMFCATPRCVLHLTANSPRARGAGNWAVLGGIVIGRLLVDSRMVCDFCARGDTDVLRDLAVAAE